MISSKKIYFVNLCLSVLPNSGCQKLKASLLRWAGVKVGQQVEVFQGVKVQGIGDLELGDHCFIGHEVLFMLNAGSKIIVEPEAIVYKYCLLVQYEADVSREEEIPSPVKIEHEEYVSQPRKYQGCNEQRLVTRKLILVHECYESQRQIHCGHEVLVDCPVLDVARCSGLEVTAQSDQIYSYEYNHFSLSLLKPLKTSKDSLSECLSPCLTPDMWSKDGCN